MRLIDADKLQADCYCVFFCGVSPEQIERQPTVKAIPIESIRKMMDKYKDWQFDNFCQSLIESWEIENETN